LLTAWFAIEASSPTPPALHATREAATATSESEVTVRMIDMMASKQGNEMRTD
jgi:hypothetical protein